MHPRFEAIEKGLAYAAHWAKCLGLGTSNSNFSMVGEGMIFPCFPRSDKKTSPFTLIQLRVDIQVATDATFL